MIDTVGIDPSTPVSSRRERRERMRRRVLRWTGWTLVAAGVLVLLYLAYLLFFTNLTAGAEQSRLLEQWERDVGSLGGSLPEGSEPAPPAARAEPDDPAGTDGAYAAMWFERDGERIVHDEPLFVVEGVTLEHLERGPGHYPDSDVPGGDGNFAVSGHRTTYGAPFYHLDRLRPGDEIHVLDRRGREFVYGVAEARVVAPTDVWVVEDDPLGTGAPTMTLTTCHPRFSAAQRLVVFARLQEA